MTQPCLQWAEGGRAVIVSIAGDALVLRSTRPWPPGSRASGVLVSEPGCALRVKVHACSRQPEGDFVIEARSLDMTRAVRLFIEAATPRSDVSASREPPR